MNEPKYQLKAFMSPFNLYPAFVMPIFFRKGEYFVQTYEVLEKVTLKGFEEKDFPQIVRIPNTVRKITPSDQMIFGFAFGKRDYIFKPKDELIESLKSRMDEIYPHAFIYLDVLKFIGDKEASIKALYRVENILSTKGASKKITKGFIRSQLNYLEVMEHESRRKTLDEIDLRFSDNEGYISYWNIYSEIENLINQFHSVHIKFKLVRSLIGTSPKIRHTLFSLGFSSRRIGKISNEIMVNANNLKSLQRLRNFIIIMEVKVLADIHFMIYAQAPKVIQKCYFKRNWKKVVKGRNGKDYKCLIIEDQNFQDESEDPILHQLF